MSPIACWTWWWPPSRPKHVVQLTTLVPSTCCVLTYTVPLCYTHNGDASTQVQRSPLSKFAFSRGPCVLSQRSAVDISFLFNTFKGCTWKFYFTGLNLLLDLFSLWIVWLKFLFQCFSVNIHCFLTAFKEGSGNSFLWLADAHHIYQTRPSLGIKGMIMKLKTLHAEFFHVVFRAKCAGDLLRCPTSENRMGSDLAKV